MAAGLIAGLLVVILMLSFSALAFTGELAPFLPVAYGLALTSAVVVMAMVSLTTSARGMVASPQESLAVVVAVILAGVVAQTEATGPDLLATALATLVVTCAAVGVGFALLGAFGAGNLVRYVPYPVIGGFFAGTGYLLVKGGLEMLLGTVGWGATFSALTRGEAVAVWVPGVVLGVALVAVVRLVRHPLGLPGAVVLAAVVFHAILLLSGTSLGAARESGWVVDAKSGGGGMWPNEIIAALGDADWGAVVGQVGGLGTLLTVGVLSLLLMASGVEKVLDHDVDLNAELRVAGWANLGASMMGGFGGFQSMSLTRLSVAAGTRSPLVGLVAGALCVTVLVLGSSILTLVPTFVLGGLLVMLGVLFLLEWLVDAARSTPRGDLFVILLILAVVAISGFLAAFAVGLVTAVILFVFRYSRIDVVTQQLTGRELPSRVERPAAHRAILQDRCDDVAILRLHGFLFFGTATALLGRFRRLFDAPADRSVAYVVVDLRRVTGIDPSAVGTLEKTAKIVAENDATLVLAGATAGVQRQVAMSGLLEHPQVRTATDLDYGLEWCEEQILASVPELSDSRGEPVWERLGELLDPEGLAVLRGRLQAVEFAAGEPVLRQGERARELYFLEAGELTSRLELGDGRAIRLRSFRSGTVVGDMSFLLGSPRSATVVAHRSSRLSRLDYEAVRELQESNPDAVAGLYRYLAEQLAERLELSNRYQGATTA